MLTDKKALTLQRQKDYNRQLYLRAHLEQTLVTSQYQHRVICAFAKPRLVFTTYESTLLSTCLVQYLLTSLMLSRDS